MTTIGSIEDLMRVLDENPSWLEAMRARLFTRELLDLPENFARLTDTVNQQGERLDQLTDVVSRQGERLDQLTDVVSRQGERLDQLTETVDRIGTQLSQFIEATDRRFDDIEVEVKRHSVQMGELKGVFAKSLFIAEAALVARDMGLRRRRNLEQEELWDMTDESDITGISTGDIRSFRKADLVLEATDREGETCYVAVEVSYTVDERDTRRAIRNAEYLTRFTGTPAFAAVAGFDADYRIQDSIEDGLVSWYQMDPFILNVE
ncbi:MAG: DUF16 domain-containing protein [Chloroflexi bacterium]|nr:DUF16 domain-containing protein [Chloroflexota bacterium]